MYKMETAEMEDSFNEHKEYDTMDHDIQDMKRKTSIFKFYSMKSIGKLKNRLFIALIIIFILFFRQSSSCCC